MSSSSDDEDLSRFKEVVDTSFVKLLTESRGQTTKEVANNTAKPKSERYLEQSSHYNDVKVPEQMQKQIWSKISAIIQKNIVFVDSNLDSGSKKRKIKGGVKLFKGSDGFLSCADVKDTYTESHNIASKKYNKKKRRIIDAEEENLNEDDKITATAITGDYVLSKEETKYWKSRKKEKLFKYKGNKKNKVLTLVE